MDPYVQLYEDYHLDNPFSDFGRNTFLGELAQHTYPNANTVLDFGCGNGFAVKKMRLGGSQWYGLEFSKAAYHRHLNGDHFYLDTTKQFKTRQFDLGYSTEVFEHIPESIVDETIEDFCRVIDKYLFLTISLRPSSDNNKYHCTLRPRLWWEEKFQAQGFTLDNQVICQYQKRTIKSTKGILESYATFGPDAKRFCDNPPYELNGEREPYFFMFHRNDIQPPPTPEPINTWVNRKGIPIIRKMLLR